MSNKLFSQDSPVFIIAEMSANHGQDFDRAVNIIKAAHASGADAIKLQTYTPDTITIDCDNEYFQIKGTIWDGRTLHDLYGEAYTPWEWHPRLKEVADDLGLKFFSTPFDHTAVDFLEDLDVPCHKIASFEMVDLPLIRKVASTGKPVIMSTGMGTEEEIEEAVKAFKDGGGTELALLKCTSAYPAPPEEMNLRTIPYIAERFGVTAGLSDHTLGIEMPIAAVAIGARIIEKHFCLERAADGPDTSFSLEPSEFKAMAEGVRKTEKALGSITFNITNKQKDSTAFRRSLFVVKSIAQGEIFTSDNIRSIRPGYGLHTRHLEDILGQKATSSIEKGTPMAWDLVQQEQLGDKGK